MYQIKKTKDYAIFKPLLGNRDVNKASLNKLVRAIREDNQLNLHPIVVNEDMRVIDGQHRLKAAESLKEDIYYIQSAVDEKHFISGNLNQKQLSTYDYINFYALHEKKESYVMFYNMLKQSKLMPKALLHLILGEIPIETINVLKLGDFQFPTDLSFIDIYDKYLDFFGFIKTKKIKPYGMFKSFQFTVAFRWLILTTNFSYETFLKKLENRWTEIRPQPTAREWYKILINICNWKSINKLELEHINEE